MSTTAGLTNSAAPAARRGHHAGLALSVIVGAQLMVVLDATIVNIALPHIQTSLKFSDTSLTWVLNAYTLTFGGLMLLGGRAGDILGRRRVFVFGILLFTFASLLGGFAQSSGLLLAARALQGVGGAIASPTAMALITSNFAEGQERNRAFGIYAAVSGSGAAVGLLAGGMLTSWLSWRWVFFVNVPIGIAIALAAPLYINESEKQPGRFDLGGALTSTAGMSALVYGFIHAAQDGWSNGVTVTAFIGAIVLLAAFGAIETRHSQPIVPLKMFADRNRASSYAVMLALVAGMMGMFFFLTLFVQNVLGYSPIKAGVAFLPISAVIIVVAQFSSQYLIRFGPKPFMVIGALLSTIGLAWLSMLSAGSGYLGGLLGPMIVFAAGMGALFVPLTITAVSGVKREESGAASALLNVMQQVGGSLGLSILATVFASAQRSEAKHLARSEESPASIGHQVLAHGISTAFTVAIAFGVIAFLLTWLISNVRPSVQDGAEESATASAR